MSTLTKMTRTVKKLEVPRPLKSTSSVIHTRNSVLDLKINSVDDLIVLTETVACEISLGQYDRCFHSNVSTMYQNLKLHGAQLEALYKDLLDRFFVLFRNGSQDENLDKRSRLYLLELIELRAKMWQESDNMSHYYKHRVTNTEPLPISNAECLISGDSIPLSLAAPPSPIETPAPLLLAPGEIMKNSGKFVKPTKIPGKNYSKDEVVIRNADSGKVMGIKGRRVHMIEELSDTIISFQRVSPGAKERLVQITGPNEENVNHAKHLIGDTIRRNASPVRLEGATGNLRDSTSSLNSSGSEESGKPSLRSHTPLSAPRPLSGSNDVSSGDFRYTVIIGSSNFIMLSGNNLQILNEAKVILDERFSNFNEVDLMSNQTGDFFRLEMDSTLGGNTLLSQSLGLNGSVDTFKANGLPSPTDDDVFVKNSSEESNGNREIPRRTRFPRSMSLSDKKEAERSLGKLSYSYEMILHYASSPLSKMPPNFQVPPELSRKTSLDFDGELYLQKMNAEVQSAARGNSEEVQDSTEAQ